MMSAIKRIEKNFSAEDLSSSFGTLSLTDDLADVMKLSILMKCHQIHKDIHNVTIGPKSAVRPEPKAERKSLWNNTKSHITSEPPNNTNENNTPVSVYHERPQIKSTRNETNIVHTKAVAELESRRLQDLNANIEKRRQKFIDFEHKQREEEKISWQVKQEAMIQTAQQQEMQIKNIVEEHAKEIEVRNRKIENHYKQLAEQKLEEAKVLNESKKQIKNLVDGISKYHTEFTVIYNEIAEDIGNMSINQRGGYATHVTTLDQLRQQLEAIVAKCKTSSDTLQQKDLSKCNDIIDLARKVGKQLHDVIPKVERSDMKMNTFKLQPSRSQIFNDPQAAAAIASPSHQPYQPTSIVSPSIVTSAVLSTPPSISLPAPTTVVPQTTSFLFVQNTNPVQSVTQLSSQTIEPPQESKAPPKLEKYVNKSLLEKYVYLQNILLEKDQISKQILDNPSLKSFKNNCKKAVNIPVNTLTDASPRHLLDKYNTLNNLLNGRPVEISGDRIHVGQHPHGIDFCMDLLAKKFVLQGDLIVSSNTAVSAFNYASVILSLWNDFPVFGDLLLGHFYRECPYLLPFYPPQVPGQTEEEFAKSQGYRISNGDLEGQDIFLKRMVGFMRLYSATLVASPKQSHNGVSRQSMAVAWQWLASIMNLQPRADITAAMIHTFLETVGFKMQHVFGKQFHKMITFLSTEYIAKIRNIDTEGPVHRLELILQDYSKNGSFSEPEGMLPTNFW